MGDALVFTEERDKHLHMCFVCREPFWAPQHGKVYLECLPLCHGCRVKLQEALNEIY